MSKYLIIPIPDNIKELMILSNVTWYHKGIPSGRYEQELTYDFIYKYLELFQYFIKTPISIEYTTMLNRKISVLFSSICKYLFDFEDNVKIINNFHNMEEEFNVLVLNSLEEFKNCFVNAIHSKITQDETFLNFLSLFIIKGLSIVEIHSLNRLELILNLKE